MSHHTNIIPILYIIRKQQFMKMNINEVNINEELISKIMRSGVTMNFQQMKLCGKIRPVAEYSRQKLPLICMCCTRSPPSGHKEHVQLQTCRGGVASCMHSAYQTIVSTSIITYVEEHETRVLRQPKVKKSSGFKRLKLKFEILGSTQVKVLWSQATVFMQS